MGAADGAGYQTGLDAVTGAGGAPIAPARRAAIDRCDGGGT